MNPVSSYFGGDRRAGSIDRLRELYAVFTKRNDAEFMQ